MKTQVIMKRELFGNEISQQSDTGFFSANDLIKSGNKYRIDKNLSPIKLSEWFRLPKVIEFMNELELNINDKVKHSGRGRNSVTWVHPFIFIDLALYISPSLKIEVYKWLYDNLLEYRNNSGDSYKKMTGALWVNCSNKSKFSKGAIKTANLIKDACKVTNWQNASEYQLQLRDKIHENISLLCDVLKDNNQAIRIGIEKSL